MWNVREGTRTNIITTINTTGASFELGVDIFKSNKGTHVSIESFLAESPDLRHALLCPSPTSQSILEILRTFLAKDRPHGVGLPLGLFCIGQPLQEARLVILLRPPHWCSSLQLLRSWCRSRG